jgi:hypothetical protein
MKANSDDSREIEISQLGIYLITTSTRSLNIIFFRFPILTYTTKGGNREIEGI